MCNDDIRNYNSKISDLGYLTSSTLRDIRGGPKFTLGGVAPLWIPPVEKFLYPKRVLWHI